MRTDDDLLRSDPRPAAVRGYRTREVTGHLAAYLAVNATLWTSWLVVALAGGTWFPWPLFPMAGWGVGLVLGARSARVPPDRRSTGPRPPGTAPGPST